MAAKVVAADRRKATLVYTRGPWIHATDVGQVGSVETADGVVIAQAQALPHDHDRSERDGNAKLCAEATAMLDIVRMIDANYCGSLDYRPPYVKAARDVMARLGIS